ncbi:hypothetical protein KCP71_23010 [Salmonella enterica subsp. enterica]|nr:hypothetical protein KCP71_23010 [Salmonella enterica subsp. enterica]
MPAVYRQTISAGRMVSDAQVSFIAPVKANQRATARRTDKLQGVGSA